VNIAKLAIGCTILGSSLFSNLANAASTPLAISFTADAFSHTPTFPNLPEMPPTDPVSGAFSFVLDDGGLTGVGWETKFFSPVAVTPFTIDGAEHNAANTGVQVDFFNGFAAQLLFGGLVGGIGYFPEQGVNDFSLMLLQFDPADPYENFSYEQMRYSTENFPNVDYFESLTGVAQVSTIPVPPAVWLFGSGLLGMIGIARRKKAA
jgi:hypothetical protein